MLASSLRHMRVRAVSGVVVGCTQRVREDELCVSRQLVGTRTEHAIWPKARAAHENGSCYTDPRTLAPRFAAPSPLACCINPPFRLRPRPLPLALSPPSVSRVWCACGLCALSQAPPPPPPFLPETSRAPPATPPSGASLTRPSTMLQLHKSAAPPCGRFSPAHRGWCTRGRSRRGGVLRATTCSAAAAHSQQHPDQPAASRRSATPAASTSAAGEASYEAALELARLERWAQARSGPSRDLADGDGRGHGGSACQALRSSCVVTGPYDLGLASRVCVPLPPCLLLGGAGTRSSCCWQGSRASARRGLATRKWKSVPTWAPAAPPAGRAAGPSCSGAFCSTRRPPASSRCVSRGCLAHVVQGAGGAVGNGAGGGTEPRGKQGCNLSHFASAALTACCRVP